jgi:hypothetical protein
MKGKKKMKKSYRGDSDAGKHDYKSFPNES